MLVYASNVGSLPVSLREEYDLLLDLKSELNCTYKASLHVLIIIWRFCLFFPTAVYRGMHAIPMALGKWNIHQ